MKNYYIDKKVFVNGKDTSFDNRFNITSFVTNILDELQIESTWLKDPGFVYNLTENIGIGTATPGFSLTVEGNSSVLYTDADSIQYRLQSGTVSSGGALITPPGPGILNEVYETSNTYLYTFLANSNSSEYGGGGPLSPYYQTKLLNLGNIIDFTLTENTMEAYLKVTDGVAQKYANISADLTQLRFYLDDNVSNGVRSEISVGSNQILIQSNDSFAPSYSRVNVDPTLAELYMNDGINESNITTGSGYLELLLSSVGTSSLRIVSDIGDGSTGIKLVGVPTYADDATAGAAGVTAGSLYKTATGQLMIKL